MPEIDLGPNGYRKMVKGRWHLPDDPKFSRTMFWVALAMIGFVAWNRDALDALTLAGLMGVLSFAAGIMFAIWKRDVY